MDTVFALSTVRGRSAVAVFRISGPEARMAAGALGAGLGPPNRARLTELVDADGRQLDGVLAIFFEGPRSFTGEDIVELQCHGGPAVIAGIEKALLALPMLRPAEPGEFTRRALENGKMDLAEVEGLADIIDAETQAQLDQAQRMAEGGLARLAQEVRGDLLSALALVESSIDFADEEVPQDQSKQVQAILGSVLESLRHEVDGVDVAERLRDGFVVAILGAPNAGKSTLLNRIAGREVAITSDLAGTTRDVIELRMDLRGLPVTFLDTAGLRETDDAIERVGVDLARKRGAQADLRVLLDDGSGIGDWGIRPDDIVVRAKADLAGSADGISGLTGAGVSELLDRVAVSLETRVARVGVATNARHRRVLEQVAESVEQALAGLEAGRDVELVAEDLRMALDQIGALVGKTGVEDILGEIFSRFCIGK